METKIWHRWTYPQNRKRFTETEQTCGWKHWMKVGGWIGSLGSAFANILSLLSGHSIVPHSLRPRELRQAPLSMGFPRQEYWSGLPYLSLGGLFDPEIEPHLLHLLHCRWILCHWATREAHKLLYIEWIHKIPLFSTGNYIQYPVIKHNGRRIYMCVHTHMGGMATRSSVLAWRTPWTEQPGGLQSLG